MRADEAKLLDFLMNPPQFVIPIFQCAHLWDEIHHQKRIFEGQICDGGKRIEGLHQRHSRPADHRQLPGATTRVIVRILQELWEY